MPLLSGTEPVPPSRIGDPRKKSQPALTTGDGSRNEESLGLAAAWVVAQDARGDAGGHFGGAELPARPQRTLDHGAEHLLQGAAYVPALEDPQGPRDRLDGREPPVARFVSQSIHRGCFAFDRHARDVTESRDAGAHLAA